MTPQQTEALKPLPCPFCNAELERWESRSQVDSPRWNHPKELNCPLSRMPSALGDPFFVVDHLYDINKWNTRSATPPQRTEQEPAGWEVGVVDGVVTRRLAPPQRKPLTDEQIEQLEQDTCAMEFPETVRAIEAAHGIKGEA